MEEFMNQFEEESINEVEDILLSLYISYFSTLYYLELIMSLNFIPEILMKLSKYS